MLEPKALRLCLGAILLMGALSCGSALRAQEKRNATEAAACIYRIGIGDQIDVSVWRHPELSKKVRVDRKGNIRLPLVKVVKTSGLSVFELEHVLTRKLERTFPEPQVNVLVSEIGSPSGLPVQCLQAPERLWDCCIARAQRK